MFFILKIYKQCNKCEEWKNILNFSKCSSFKGGLQYSCKECHKKYREENKDRLSEQRSNYRKENREEISEKAKKVRKENIEKYRLKNNRYYVNNKEKILENQKEYYKNTREDRLKTVKIYGENNKEKLREKKKIYVLINKKKLYENKKIYYSNNKDKFFHWSALRRARKLKATPIWSNLEEIEKIYEERNRISEETGILYHVDHIVPLQGELVSGLHVPNNLQIIPASENLSKKNKFEIV